MVEKVTCYRNLIKKEHRLYCPDCDIELQSSNIVLTTIPPLYQYYCPQCNFSYTSQETYPWVEFTGDKQCEYPQEAK